MKLSELNSCPFCGKHVRWYRSDYGVIGVQCQCGAVFMFFRQNGFNIVAGEKDKSRKKIVGNRFNQRFSEVSDG